MKFPWTSLVAIVCLLLSYAATGTSSPSQNKSFTPPTIVSEAIIKQRINSLNSPVEIKIDSAVVAYIKDYVIYGQKATPHLIGRTALYFPIFEHYLKVYRLPEQLKYLAVIESQLQPHAESQVGAMGLWQFTSATARQFHLAINEYVDERRDPIRSTEAAVAYLSQLYGKYRDWALVLAAYNCGPARLNQAISAAGERNFWKIRSYLPKETQMYVPRFIAATYLMNYYTDHGLIPVYPSYDLQLSRTVKVFQAISFQEIATQTGVEVSVLSALNPSYKKDYIPASEKGHYLILPESAMTQAKPNFYNLTPVAIAYNDKQQQTHVVSAGETLEGIAQRFKCSVKDIQYWNNLPGEQLYFRQELVILKTPAPVMSWRS
jgi:membrane-bound lytic murein transglycosylase D